MKKSLLFNIALMALITIVVTNANVLAEEVNNEATEDEVVVTATRTEESLSQSAGVTEVITQEEIEKSGKTTVAQVIAAEAIPVASNGGVSGVAMVQLDGSSCEQTLVLVNGIAANTGCAGSVDLSYFPVAGIKKIETVHGPLSSLYGANALGGVVNIITDLTGDYQNQVLLSGGSFNNRNLGFNVQQKNWGIACGTYADDGFRERTESAGNYLLAQYNFHDEQDRYLKLYLQAMTRSAEIPGSESFPLSDARQGDQNFNLNLNGKAPLFNGSWEYKVYSQYLDVQYTEYGIPYFHQTWNHGFDCAGLYTLGNHELLTGVTYKHQNSDSNITMRHSQDNCGLFIQDSWFITDKFSLISGIRSDYSTNYPAPLSPRIYLSYQVNPDFTLKLGYGKAFRAPTMNELYWQQPAFGMFGNENLKPEQGERYDLIGFWKQGTHSLNVNLYQSNMSDGIRWVTNDFITYTVANIAVVKTTGVNLNWAKSWGETFSAKIGYRWLDEKGWNENTQSFDNDLNVFGNQLSLGFGWHFLAWDCRLDWKFAANRNNQMPDYNTGTLSVNYRPDNAVTWILAIDNLTNQKYQVIKGYPMPGIQFNLSLKYDF